MDEEKVENEKDDVDIDFGALSKGDKPRVALHESLISRRNLSNEQKSPANELLISEPEENLADRLRLRRNLHPRPQSFYLTKIKGLCDAGDIQAATSEFYKMIKIEHLVPSWKIVLTLLDSLVVVGDSSTALDIFKQMKEMGMQPNQGLYCRLFGACSESIQNWFRENKYILPYTNKSVSKNILAKEKIKAMNTALGLEINPSEFGGPAVKHVYYLWRHLMKDESKFTLVSFNAFIYALAKAGDIHGCLRGLDMLFTNTYSEIVLLPDKFTLTAVLCAFEPANLKRKLVRLHCANTTNTMSDITDGPSISPLGCSSLECALVVWHSLMPSLKSKLDAHVFHSFVSVLSIVDYNQVDGSRSIRLDTNCPTKSNQISLDLDHSNRNLTKLDKTNTKLPNRNLSSLVTESGHNMVVSNPDVNVPELYDCQSVHIDWNDTQLALKSPINLLFPNENPIEIRTDKIRFSWQNLALLGGLQGFVDTMINYYKCKPSLHLINSLIKLSPPCDQIQNNHQGDDFDKWELGIFNIFAQSELKPDLVLFNSLINRRVRCGWKVDCLLSELVLKGLRPDSVSWSILARSVKTVTSLKGLLIAYQKSCGLCPETHLFNGLVVRPGMRFFMTILSTAKFHWELRLFVLQLMCNDDNHYYEEIQFDSDRGDNVDPGSVDENDNFEMEVSTNFNGYRPDRALIASIEIDIAQYRALISKNIIPEDGSSVPKSVTGGSYIPKYSLRAFHRFVKFYKSWLKSTHVINYIEWRQNWKHILDLENVKTEIILQGMVNVITSDGRTIVGTLKGFDNVVNLIIKDSHERVFSPTDGVEQVPLGLFIVRGQNVAVVGELDEDLDRRIDFTQLRAEPLNPIAH